MSSETQGLSFAELASYTESLASRWFAYFEQNAAALSVEIGGRTGTVRELLAHIALAEERLADYLTGIAPAGTPREFRDLDELRAFYAEVRTRVTEFLSSANETELQQKVEFAGGLASKRKVLAQIFVHGIHHWAQIAMAVRQAGFPPTKPQDIIMSDAMH